MPGKDMGVVPGRNGTGIGKGLRKLAFVGFWVALVAFALASIPAAEGSPSGQSPTGSISGTVTRDDGGTPIQGAVVFVNDFRTGAAAGRAISDTNGTHTVIGLRDGQYRVHVNATLQGFVLQYYDGALDSEGATAVSVVNGTETPRIDFAPGFGGSISGTVVSAIDGTPVVGAEVFAEGRQGSIGNATTSTDGTYTIPGLANDNYVVLVDATGQEFLRQYYDNVLTSDLATLVTVAGEAVSNIDFSLGTGSTIRGVVRQAGTDTPVVSAHVQVREFSTRRFAGSDITDANGEYAITGLAAGTYRVAAHAIDQGFSALYFSNTPERSLATPVVVGANEDVAGINFYLDAGGSISGTVTTSVAEGETSTPIAGAFVRAYDPRSGGGTGDAVAGTDGTYTIPGLPSGEYIVEAQAADQGFASEFYNDTSDWSQATRVTIFSGAAVQNINFTLDSSGSISGRITQEDGVTPIGKVFVHANSYDKGAYGNGATSAADGTYIIEGLMPGDYRVETWVPDELGFAREFYDDITDWSKATLVSVTAGQITGSIDFALGTGGTISGTVYHGDGATVVAGANVWASDYDGDGSHGWARTGADGTYTITGLATGEYRVEAAAASQGFVWEFYQGISDYQLATRVAVVSGLVTANIDFTLDVGGIISGTAYEADGVTPIANADVWANSYDGGGGNGYARTDSEGEYTIRGLASGNYRVEAAAASQGFVREFYQETSDYQLANPVAVASGQTTPNIDFTLDVGGSISGTVYEADGITPIANAGVWAERDGGGGDGASTRADGTYTITGLPAGDYRVEASATSHGFVREYYAGTTDYNSATLVEVSVGADTPGIDFTLDVKA